MINIKHMSFSYNGTRPYDLKDINIKFPKSSFTSIIGENGSGKTTLLKLILGYLKPTEGEIDINLKSIGYVPQKIDNFNQQFSITVYEILKIHGNALKIKNIKDEILRVLDIVNIKELKNKLIGSLSGGQQQRVFIARALMGSPNTLILDEPSTGLDEKTQNEIYDLLKKLNIENNVTILCVEHNREKSLKYSSHILEIKNNMGIIYDNYNEDKKNNYKRRKAR
ncbi:MAG: metal ABC transporter ATP-binding protein [Clostridium perfringens]|nr:metal ABC transporter ATP-binding protein [Clostridium perfringens]